MESTSPGEDGKSPDIDFESVYQLLETMIQEAQLGLAIGVTEGGFECSGIPEHGTKSKLSAGGSFEAREHTWSGRQSTLNHVKVPVRPCESHQQNDERRAAG